MAKLNLRADHVGQHRTAFEKNKKIVLANAELCAICGNPLEGGFKYPHPLSTVVDHIVPIAHGGHPSDLANLQAAHRWCNTQKSDRLTPSKYQDQEQTLATNALPQHFSWADYKMGA